MLQTKEPQYQIQIETFNENGLSQLGLMTSHIWRSDPRHLGFLLSRYKFCAKMLIGKKSVMEVGCGDGFGLPIVLQSVKSVHGIDFDPIFIENAKQINAERIGVSFEVLDITQQQVGGKFDAVYSLDVIEHIDVQDENTYLSHICAALNKDGVCIIGTPNIFASQHASVWSQQGHINMKDESGLRDLLLKFFDNVFIFSMSDEVVHTGFYPMAHYLMAIAVGVRE